MMSATIFEAFRLVGGTALSLQLGHRKSLDIDLFTDADYGTIDFEAIASFFHQNFPYVDASKDGLAGMGKSYIIGKSEHESIKLDVYQAGFFRGLGWMR